MTGLLAERAPALLKTLREHDPDFVLLDGTLAECDRVGDGRADYSAKPSRHDVNVQSSPFRQASCCGSRAYDHAQHVAQVELQVPAPAPSLRGPGPSTPSILPTCRAMTSPAACRTAARVR